jgi:hypothetical protein
MGRGDGGRGDVALPGLGERPEAGAFGPVGVLDDFVLDAVEQVGCVARRIGLSADGDGDLEEICVAL